MNLKELVIQIMNEKHLTKPELNKREEIVKAMKPKFKGNTSSLYAIATSKAKKIAEETVTNIGGSNFSNGDGEQYATPKAFGKNKRLTFRKSFLKELIQQEIKNIKK